MKIRPTSAADLNALIQLAETRNPLAQFRLGEIYADCWDVHEDYGRAIIWYRKAADQQLVAAYPRLACLLRRAALYKTGFTTEAMKWMREAALHGCFQSAYWLSEMYCLDLPCRVKARLESGIQTPGYWVEEICQSAMWSFIWLNVCVELPDSIFTHSEFATVVREELLPELCSSEAVETQKSIATILHEVNWRKHETPVNDSLAPKNELLLVDPEDLVEYVITR